MTMELLKLSERTYVIKKNNDQNDQLYLSREALETLMELIKEELIKP